MRKVLFLIIFSLNALITPCFAQEDAVETPPNIETICSSKILCRHQKIG